MISLKQYHINDLVGKKIRILQDMPDDVGFVAGMIVVVSSVERQHKQFVDGVLEDYYDQSMYLNTQPVNGVDWPDGVSYGSYWCTQRWNPEQHAEHNPHDKRMWELVNEDVTINIDITLNEEQIKSILSSTAKKGGIMSALKLAVEAYYEA